LDGFVSECRPTTRHTRPAGPASALPALIKEAIAVVITVGQSWLSTERSDDAAKGEPSIGGACAGSRTRLCALRASSRE